MWIGNGKWKTYQHIVSSLQEGQIRRKEQPYNDDSIDQHTNHHRDIDEYVKPKDQRVDELIPFDNKTEREGERGKIIFS